MYEISSIKLITWSPCGATTKVIHKCYIMMFFLISDIESSFVYNLPKYLLYVLGWNSISGL